MTLTDTELQASFIPTHHHQYWQARRLAFAAIRQLEAALKDVRSAPLYTCSGYDAEGEPTNISENIAPFDRLAVQQGRVADNPNAMSILEAQKRCHLTDPAHF